mgnify:CR=1 FL=1
MAELELFVAESELLNGMIMLINMLFDHSKGASETQVCVLPLDEYNLIKTTQAGSENDKSVLQCLQELYPMIRFGIQGVD